jgi:hypothetical protein
MPSNGRTLFTTASRLRGSFEEARPEGLQVKNDAWSDASAALAAIRHWPDKLSLVRFALDRRGYGDSDGGFGITYPGDLDEYAREIEGCHIPDGFVLAYGFWGPAQGGYEILIPEKLYLEVLAGVLEGLDLPHEAASVRALDR